MDEPLNEKYNEHEASLENELKRIKLSLEHGMDFSQSITSPDLPLEIEGQFLDYIQNWEDQHAQRKMTTVYDFAGRPSFKPVNEIPDEEISVALDKAMELLHSHSISLDTLCEVDERELYRFITEELLKVEIDDIRIDGMMHCFTFEDFYPNHPYDIKNRCTEVINHIADNETEKTTIPWGLADQIISSGRLLTKEEFNEHIIRFRELFSSLTLKECNYKTVTHNEDEATAEVFVNYAGITESLQTIELTGNCTFNLTCKYGWWTINQLEMPWSIM